MKFKCESQMSSDSAMAFGLSRRDFLKSAGGGILFLFTIGLPASGTHAQGRDGYPEDFNAYLRVGADGRVSCFTGKIEMGQGIITSLAQMLAEELDVELDMVDMVMGDTALCPYDRGTTGSRTTKNFGPPLRRAAATARYALLQMASEELEVPDERLTVDNGVISDLRDTGKNISYGSLAEGKSIDRHIDREISVKDRSRFAVCGKATLRTDAVQKVTGKALFTDDIRRPGMLYASVLRPPSHDARLRKVDTSAAKLVEGVLIIEEDDLIAALHEKPDIAELALTKVKTDYDGTKQSINNETIFLHLEKSATSERVVSEKGDVDSARSNCDRIIETSFFNHYVAHAPMENHAVLVDITGDEVKIWATTQTPFRARSVAADTLGMEENKVRVMPPFIGGGFGGKKAGLDIVQACRLAKITGRPVQLSLTRKEEFFYDTFRPAALIQAKAGIDSNGLIHFWDFTHYFSGTRSSEPIYDIPHYRVRFKNTGRGEPGAHPFATGAWRGPGSNSNVHAMESQVDILAEAAGQDPVTFRMRNLSDERMKKVLESAAGKFGHSFSKGPGGNGYGIACTDYLNTYVATIAEVAVDRKSGSVKVLRIVCAQDMGEIINPQGAKLQIEGGLTMGLGYCLGEEIQFVGGNVLTENFDTYEIPRFSWSPKIDVVLVDNPELAPQGCGEPAITTMGAAIANAVYDAVGVRLFTLPMTPDRIKKAIEEG